VKRSLSVALGLSSLLVIAGCAADTSEERIDEALAVAEGCSPSGAGVEAVSVSGEFGATPEVTFDAPLSAVATQRLVVIEGTGEEVQDGDILSIDYSLYNAATGDLIEDSGYSDISPTVLNLDTDAPTFVGVSLTAACSTVGSRVMGLIPPLEAFGPDGAPEFGLAAGQSLLFILDVIEIKLPPAPPLDRIEGEPVDPPAGFPEVTYDADGAPTVTIPEGDIPTEFALSTVITGEGAEVGGGDVVIVHYHGVNWNTGEVFDSSWERGAPTSFPTGGVIAGFRDGLIGQTVGSRVIIVIPPELGYGPSGGTPDGSIGATDTIVFVVDILGLQ
jgi:peptidylprolyl isomerase